MHRQLSSSPVYSTSPPPTPRILSPPPKCRAISPPPPIYEAIRNCLTIEDLNTRYTAPPYLKIDDLFRMFGRRFATTKSAITTAIDDPFARQFVSPPHIAPNHQILTNGFRHSKERAGVYIYVGNRHRLSPDSAGAMFSSPLNMPSCERCRPPPLLNTDKWQAMLNWPSPAAERHHLYCLYFAARNLYFFSKSFSISTFSFLNHMASYPSTTAHSFDMNTCGRSL